MAQAPQARVVLTGRSALDASRQARFDELSAQTGQLSYRQVDLCDLDQVRQLIVRLQDDYGRLNGILHSAGMIADNFILKKTSAKFSEVLAPKVSGTFNLDQASKDLDLDFFVLFSSIASVTGNVGQADYVTANAFMDQFAAYRNQQVVEKQRHGRTRSINWSLWQAGGMELHASSQKMVQQLTGMQAIQTSTGLDAFSRSLAQPYDQMLVVEGLRSKISSYLQKMRIFKPVSGEPITAPVQIASVETVSTV